MLDKLKSLLTTTPEVDYVDFEDGLLAVRCSKKLTLATTKVKLRTSRGTLLAYVEMQSLDDANGVYRALLLNHQFIFESLEINRRADLRLPRAMRVTSADLPGYAAITEDLSVSGARVTTTALLEPGIVIDLKIDLDDPELPALNIASEVRWAARRLDENFHAGLQFLNLNRHQTRTIDRYVSERLELERKLHTLQDSRPS